MVRPERFELPTFWFVSNVLPTLRNSPSGRTAALEHATEQPPANTPATLGMSDSLVSGRTRTFRSSGVEVFQNPKPLGKEFWNSTKTIRTEKNTFSVFFLVPISALRFCFITVPPVVEHFALE